MSTTITHREGMSPEQAKHLQDRRETRAAFDQDDSDENFAAMKQAERVVRQDRKAKRNAKATLEIAAQEESAKKAKKVASAAKAKATREAKKAQVAEVITEAEGALEGPLTLSETIAQVPTEKELTAQEAA
jgi:FKBP-type peptidyl-prolyl cis-trans isomerase